MATTEIDASLFIKMTLDAWEVYNKRVDDLLEKLSDEQLLKETATGRNTGIYLLGHLVAVTDGIAPLIGAGEKSYPELTDIFLVSPDKSGKVMPSIEELKQYWKKANERLRMFFTTMKPADWFSRHTAVTEESFIKEPFRNKLNIIINRTNHQSYHLGQLIYLLPGSRE